MFGAATSRRPSAGSWCWALRSGTPTSSKPGPTRGCRRNAVCLTSCLTSQTSSAPGCCCCSVHRPAPETLQECLGGVSPAEAQQAWPLASLPAVHGGLGLQAAERTAPAGTGQHGWTHALPVIRSRLPGAADRCLAALEQGAEGTIPCLREAAAAKNLSQREGWEACPGWHAAYEGARRGLATFTIATACCCRLCSYPLGPCYARKAGHTLVQAVSSAERTSTHPRPAGHAARVAAPLAFTPAA